MAIKKTLKIVKNEKKNRVIVDRSNLGMKLIDEAVILNKKMPIFSPF